MRLMRGHVRYSDSLPLAGEVTNDNDHFPRKESTT